MKSSKRVLNARKTLKHHRMGSVRRWCHMQPNFFSLFTSEFFFINRERILIKKVLIIDLASTNPTKNSMCSRNEKSLSLVLAFGDFYFVSSTTPIMSLLSRFSSQHFLFVLFSSTFIAVCLQFSHFMPAVCTSHFFFSLLQFSRFMK